MKITLNLQNGGPAPEGYYNLTVVDWNKSTSKAGNEMVIATLQFCDNGYRDFLEYILCKQRGRLERFRSVFVRPGEIPTPEVRVVQRTYTNDKGKEITVNALASWPYARR